MDQPNPPSSGFVLSGAQRLVLKVLLNAVALGLTAQLFDSIWIEGFLSAVFAVIMLALTNTFIRPVLIFLTLPLTLLTLGLFTLVINALLFKLTSAVPFCFSLTRSIRDGFSHSRTIRPSGFDCDLTGLR
ncbi:MAG: putative transrane protein [Deltaproteobacteria bacterium]|nr:putative transrane protein [Deltaproteobacteria bacterium]